MAHTVVKKQDHDYWIELIQEQLEMFSGISLTEVGKRVGLNPQQVSRLHILYPNKIKIQKEEGFISNPTKYQKERLTERLKKILYDDPFLSISVLCKMVNADRTVITDIIFEHPEWEYMHEVKPRKQKKCKPPGVSIAEFNRRAREHGMSYGQYEAFLRMEAEK